MISVMGFSNTFPAAVFPSKSTQRVNQIAANQNGKVVAQCTAIADLGGDNMPTLGKGIAPGVQDIYVSKKIFGATSHHVPFKGGEFVYLLFHCGFLFFA